MRAGPALSLAPLVIASRGVSVPVAVLCLTSTLSLQAFCYAGFHAYVQVTMQNERHHLCNTSFLVSNLCQLRGEPAGFGCTCTVQTGIEV